MTTSSTMRLRPFPSDTARYSLVGLVLLFGSIASNVSAQVPTNIPLITRVVAAPNHLWPANGQMVPVSVDVQTALTASGSIPRCGIDSVKSNKGSKDRENDQMDSDNFGSTTNSDHDRGDKKHSDWQITGPLTVNLRAEANHGNHSAPRVYTITVRCAHVAAASGTRAVASFATAAAPSSSSTQTVTSSVTSAAVDHNAPSKYGATFYYFSGYESLPFSTVYPPTFTWNYHEQVWWDTIVQRARDANIGWFAVNSWGQDMTNGADPGGVDPTDGVPYMSKLMTAIDSATTPTLKLALFDDTTSEVMRKNRDKGRGDDRLPTDDTGPCFNNPACRFDLQDSGGAGEGGWFYFYDQQWKRFFDAVPDQYRFKIEDRPVVFMWRGAAEWYSNIGSFSNMIWALRWACLNRPGDSFDPYIIVEKQWQDLDPDISTPGIVDTIYEWFNPSKANDPGKTYTLTGIGTVQVGHAIPGYDGSLFVPARPVVDRNNGGVYNVALNNAAYGSLVLIESINNVDENAHIIDTTNWGDRELSQTLWYTVNRP